MSCAGRDGEKPVYSRNFFNRVASQKGDFLQDFIDIPTTRQIGYCVICRLAVNAYVEPVVSLNLDVVVALERLDELVGILNQRFQARKHLRSINVSSPESELRIRIQTDPRYQDFISRASRRTVLGFEFFVASLEDVLLAKS